METNRIICGDNVETKPKLLDLFCGAGGCSMGYHRAGFDVTGVDINHQKNYPFEFIQADALHYPLDGFDVIHASPPCQAFSKGHYRSPRFRAGKGKSAPDLIDWIRLRLLKNGKLFVIENVLEAPLDNPIMLCGTMFDGLKVYRHRLFECGGFDPGPAPGQCNHTHQMGKSKGEYHTLDKSPYITCVGHNFEAKSGRIAMQIDWMTRDEIAQAIPPAYTEWIGKQLMTILKAADSLDSAPIRW